MAAPYDVKQMEDFIRKGAAARGINPEYAVRAFRAEGLKEGVWQSLSSKGNIREPSYGPAQLLVGGEGTGFPRGMGNDFMDRTGLDPSDPKNVYQGVDFALDRLATGGWSPWYGAKAVGLTGMEGIDPRSATGERPPVPGGVTSNANPITDYSIGPKDATGQNEFWNPISPGGRGPGPKPEPEPQTTGTDFRNPISGYGGGPQGVKPPAAKGQKSWRDWLAEGMAGFGKGYGSGGGAPEKAAAPVTQTVMTPAQSIAPIDPTAAQGQRQKLAEALARLNTGRLFVG